MLLRLPYPEQPLNLWQIGSLKSLRHEMISGKRTWRQITRNMGNTFSNSIHEFSSEIAPVDLKHYSAIRLSMERYAYIQLEKRACIYSDRVF